MPKESKKQRIWLVGGGTGGHIVPLLAVAEILQQHKNIKLQYVGDKRGPEYTLAQNQGLDFIAVSTGKMRRHFGLTALILNMRDAVRIKLGIIQSLQAIAREQPRVIFSKGGPASLPVVLAAAIARVPVVTHESDVVMGWANRMNAYLADKVLVSFPASLYPQRYARKLVTVGLPIRRVFCAPQRKDSHRSRRPMILVMGGSQGSVAINETLAPILPELLKEWSVMHITGSLSYERFCALRDLLPKKLADNYGVIDYTSDVASYMRDATVVVVRASSTIFELASLGKAMILIPLPTAANNHQVKNAEYFAERGAALIELQHQLTPEKLYESICSVVTDRALRRSLEEGARQFASCDATKRVVALLQSYLKTPSRK